MERVRKLSYFVKRVEEAATEIPGGVQILELSKFPHEDDHYLAVVLAERKSGDAMEWVVWTYNDTTQSMSHGHYFREYKEAREKYKSMIK